MKPAAHGFFHWIVCPAISLAVGSASLVFTPDLLADGIPIEPRSPNSDFPEVVGHQYLWYVNGPHGLEPECEMTGAQPAAAGQPFDSEEKPTAARLCAASGDADSCPRVCDAKAPTAGRR